MNNKILIEIIIPSLDQRYDLYVPINIRLGKLKLQIIKTINDMNNNEIETNNLQFYNKETLEQYKNNDLIYYTNIRNGTSLILL